MNLQSNRSRLVSTNMFSGIATYLFGTGSEGSEGNEGQRSALLSETEIKGLDGEDWVLINMGLGLELGAPGPLQATRAAGDSGPDPAQATSIPVPREAPEARAPRSQLDDRPAPETLPPLRAQPLPPRPARQRQARVRALPLPHPAEPFPSLAPVPQRTGVTAMTSSSLHANPNLAISYAAAVSSPSNKALFVSQALVPVASHGHGQGHGAQPQHLAMDMEGSWFVTPPPCFTHPNTFTLETSPLEDILIEHPSVSVFSPRPAPLELDSPMVSSTSSSGSPSSPIQQLPAVVLAAAVAAAATATASPTPASTPVPATPKAAPKGRSKAKQREAGARGPLSEVTNGQAGHGQGRRGQNRAARKAQAGDISAQAGKFSAYFIDFRQSLHFRVFQTPSVAPFASASVCLPVVDVSEALRGAKGRRAEPRVEASEAKNVSKKKEEKSSKQISN